MTKNQAKTLRRTAIVIGLLLLPGVPGLIQQILAQRKAEKLFAAQVAAMRPSGQPSNGQYYKLTFDVLKHWTYVEGKTPVPAFIKVFDKQNVEMLGYMMPLNDVDNIKEFVLVPSLWGCCYGQPPAVNHIVAVKMPPGQTTKFYSNPIQVKGRFSVGETKQDGYLVSLYVLTVDKIVEAKGLN